MQSVALLAAGATAGVLAMHCVSRARENFEPGAAWGLQRAAIGVWRAACGVLWFGVFGRRRSTGNSEGIIGGSS
jgi:hypothetical protein